MYVHVFIMNGCVQIPTIVTKTWTFLLGLQYEGLEKRCTDYKDKVCASERLEIVEKDKDQKYWEKDL